MKKRNLTFKISSIVISFVLIAAMALCMTSCGKTGTATDTSSTIAQAKDEVKVIGEGKTSFKFSVTDAEGKTAAYTINTDKATLGEALLEAEIIKADEQKTGFINTVNGVTLNWDTDKAYWALYVGSEMAQKGVNETEITDSGEYSFVYTKG